MTNKKKDWRESSRKLIEVKYTQLKQDPISEYVEFIKLVVAKFFGIKIETMIKGKKLYCLIPRVFAIALINHHTDLKSDVMFFFNRNRTTWYSSEEEFEALLCERPNKNSFEKLKKLTSKEEFEGFKSRVAEIKISNELNYTWEVYKSIENQL